MNLLKRVNLRGVRLIDPIAGVDAVTDIGVSDGRLVAPQPNAPEIDCRGLVLTPGLIDLHVHFRDPGNTVAEDQHSGAEAAARGGFTRVVTMPNTRPACDSVELIRRQQDTRLATKILPSACLTVGRAGAAVADLAALAAAGAVAFTDDGSTVADDAVMLAAMKAAGVLGKPVMDHAMDPLLTGDAIIRDSPLARRLGLPIMAPEAEVAAVERDIRLAREAGCRLHIQHISCAGSLVAIREAQRAGLPVSGEATPHHLLLAAEEIVKDDGNLRMNPPLGNRADRAALRAAVLDGTVAMLATDHAPHAPETKSRGYAAAPSGVIGMECAVGVTYQALVLEEGMALLDFVACWSTAPARLLGLTLASLQENGVIADFALFDFATPWRVDASKFASRSRNTPFDGMELYGRALLTVCEGRVTWRDPTWTAGNML